VSTCSYHFTACFLTRSRSASSLTDERFSTQKALQTVAAGQQAENLLDFDDAPSPDGQPSGLAATEVLSFTPAAANLLAGTSSNPLDDLVSIFGGMGGSGMSGGVVNGSMGDGSLGGLSFGGSAFGSSASAAPRAVHSTAAGLGPTVVSPVQAQQPQEDLLGLF
jgi:AP-1 complex subunit beta-1